MKKIGRTNTCRVKRTGQGAAAATSASVCKYPINETQKNKERAWLNTNWAGIRRSDPFESLRHNQNKEKAPEVLKVVVTRTDAPVSNTGCMAQPLKTTVDMCGCETAWVVLHSTQHLAHMDRRPRDYRHQVRACTSSAHVCGKRFENTLVERITRGGIRNIREQCWNVLRKSSMKCLNARINGNLMMPRPESEPCLCTHVGGYTLTLLNFLIISLMKQLFFTQALKKHFWMHQANWLFLR
jgi:hypothetical protein